MEKLNANAHVNQGFDTMRPILAAFVGQELMRVNKSNWWQYYVLGKLSETYARNLPKSGDWDKLIDSLDVMACFQVIDRNWMEIFKYKMTVQQRNWVKELQNTRNEWAHATGAGMDEDSAWRALDTMARLMEPIDLEITEELRKLMRLVRYKTEGASTDAPTQPVEPIHQPTAAALSGYARPWRQIAEPHQDVAKGVFRQAEFAADLSQVLRGEAMPEYQDPVEFFARTYITDGMRGMLSKAAQRVSGNGGEPVIQLKTAFGGGKTHSMLALYHMMRATAPSSLHGIADVLSEAGISHMPKVKVAVLVGSFLNPIKVRRPAKFPGITINTLWGEMAAQLAEQCGNPRLYDLVKEADKKGISPGSGTLRELFDTCGPCLILIDELVAYARKLFGYKQGEIPAGTFENVLSFVQELTEAARASKNSLVVASIPESETEAGGEAGIIALERIEHTFGRMEAVWKPVVAEEGFEIVRRRLFKPITDQAAVDQVCTAYFDIYRNNLEEYPIECREADYIHKLKKCYPIHPEVFDRLYNDWSTLESFQRTRGVLRFMASVIHDLYTNNDGGSMILPGSINFGRASIREELTRYLSPGWDSIIEQEVDGNRSRTKMLDEKSTHYLRYMACRRVARTVLLGSAPDVRDQRIRGLEAARIRLGVMQPGEASPTYNDALARLMSELTYLYSGSDHRYWFDTRPTLRKTVAERAQILRKEDIVFELEKMLKEICRNKEPFDSVHVAPSSSGDVPDQTAVRLVLLSPSQAHKGEGKNSDADEAVREMLELRGTAPRMYRNMIAFLAPDSEAVGQAIQDMRMLMAWESIQRDADLLNLDNAQKIETRNALKRYGETVHDRIQDAYGWLLIPSQEGTSPVTWSSLRLAGAENPAAKAARKMMSDELLIEKLSPRILSMEMDQYNLWGGHEVLSVRELCEYYTRYLYLHRMKSQKVLTDSIEAGVRSGEYFAYADGQDATGRYQGLCLGDTGYLHLTTDGLIVRLDDAKRQIEEDRVKQEREHKSNGVENGGPTNTVVIPGTDSGNSGQTPPMPKPKKNTHFYGSIRVDPNKLGTTAGLISAEVLQHLNKLSGSHVTVTLDIQVDIPDGVPEDTARTVRENCHTLRFETSEFSED